jgi:uncharacterized membrane protein YeaQ/YmgE (transglycosylase-associated protein family)
MTRLLTHTVTVLGQSDNTQLLWSILSWLVIGLVAGFLASVIVNKRGEGILMDLVLGLVGAFVGGFIFRLLGIHSNGSILISIGIATLGAILILWIYHALISRGRHA